MRRIRTKELIYHPFPSSAPDDTLIAEVIVEVKRNSTVYRGIRKGDLYADGR